jgi:hypothetical protein
MSHQIMLCFVRSDSDILEASWLNRAASSLASNEDGSAPFIHSELLFCPPGAASGKDSVAGLACSIVYGGAVHLETKRFSRKEWFFRSMNCSKGQYNEMMSISQGKWLQPYGLFSLLVSNLAISNVIHLSGTCTQIFLQ